MLINARSSAAGLALFTAVALPVASPAATSFDALPTAEPAVGRAELRDALHHALTAAPLRMPATFTSIASHVLPCEDWECPRITPFPAGDLDGDGRDDLFTNEYDGTWTLHARRGLDAEVLWSAPVFSTSYAYAQAFMGRIDVDADGSDDVVLFERTEHETGTHPQPAAALAVELDQRIRALRPHDGSLIWERRYEGLLVVAGASAAFTGVAAHRDVVVDVHQLADANGEGGDDLLVELSTGASAFAVASGVGHQRVVASSIDGRDGSDIGVIEFLGAPAIVPARDVDGDGLADIVLLAAEPTPRLAAYPAAGGSQHWSVPIPTTGRYPAIAALPLTGRGAEDVLVHSTVVERGFIEQFVGVRGSDGATLWTRENQERRDDVAVAGDVDGDGGSDLVRIADVYAAGFQLVGASVTAFSGATGSNLWTQILPADVDEETTAGSVFCVNCVIDITGDGIADVIVDRAAYTPDEVDDFVVALDGSDGAVLWESRTGATSGPRWVGGDVDADGAQDVWVRESEEDAFTVHLFAGPSLAPLWSFTDGDEHGRPGWEFLPMQLDGEPGRELVVHLEEWDGENERVSFAVAAYGPGGRLWLI